MLKKKVRVQIEGRNYSLISTEDTRYVQHIAEEVTSQIHEAAKGATKLDTRDCAILAALNFCDEKIKAESRINEVVKKADRIIAKTNELNKACSEYKEKLTEAINENTRLTKRIKELEDQLNGSANGKSQQKNDKTPQAMAEQTKKIFQPDKKQNEQESEQAEKTAQEKHNEKLMGYVPMTQCSLFDDDKNE